MKRNVLLVALLCCLAAIGADAATEWPHLRGPNLDGRVFGTQPFSGGPIGLELAWKIPLGSGYSGIAVADGRAVTLFSDGELDVAVALDVKTGKELWRYRIGETYKGHDGSDDGPLSSPLIDGGVVYGLGPRGQLFALRLANGKPIWTKTLEQDFGAAVPQFGFTTTPLVVGDVLVVQVGGPDGRAICGLDKKTGAERWTTGKQPVHYQSPAVLELGGERQLVAVSGKQINGLRPATGEVLWQHDLGEPDFVQSATPTPAGEDRFLVPVSGDAVVFRVTREQDGWQVEELYRTKALGNTYALPVYHEGHLYGFRSQFLSCVDANTGTRVWRSRPPGGRGLILVDGHLVVFGAEGNVVVAKASPAGYEEVARMQALGGSGYTWPSFARGKVFVRNLEGMASVAVVADTEPAREAAPVAGLPDDAFGRFVRRVEASERKRELVDAFLQQHEQLPIVEGQRVHFLYHGKVEDIAVSGTMIPTGNPEPMRRIAGTDLYYKSYELAPGARYEYRFQVDYDESVTDPRNPRTVPATFGEQALSELVMPGYVPAAHLEPPAGDRRGKLESFSFASETLDNEREVTVYLPPGYEASGRSYPLLIVFDGKAWLEKGLMNHTLDNLVGASVAPLVVVFVEPIGQWWLEAGGSGTDAYVGMLAEELVPRLEQKYRLIARPDARAVMGTSHFGVTAAYAALRFPGVFGKAAIQSVAMGLGSDDALRSRLEAEPRPDVEFYLDWNRYEARNVDSGQDLRQDNRLLAELLRQSGYSFAGGEVLDSHGWGSWRARSDRILRTFFPAE